MIPAPTVSPVYLPGTYKLTGDLTGFRQAVQTDVQVGTAAQIRIDLVMQVGAAPGEIVQSSPRMKTRSRNRLLPWATCSPSKEFAICPSLETMCSTCYRFFRVSAQATLRLWRGRRDSRRDGTGLGECDHQWPQHQQFARLRQFLGLPDISRPRSSTPTWSAKFA